MAESGLQAGPPGAALERLRQVLRGSSEAQRSVAQMGLPLKMDQFLGPAALARLRAAAVLVPVLFGYLQVLAIRKEVIDLSLGVAITVAACVMVFVVLLALIMWGLDSLLLLGVQQLTGRNA